MANAAEAEDPTRIVQASGSTAGLAGDVANLAGRSGAARSVATAAQAARTAGEVVQRADSVASILSSSGGTRLEPVRFEFALTQGPEIAWTVKRLSCRSELSQIYELRLELVCDDVTAPVDEMVGAPCELLIERGELVHAMYGIVDELDDVGPDQGRLHASVRVIPAFGLLAQQVDTRIFQGQTVIEIVTEILGEALAVYGRELDASTFIKRQYHARDYCTQFRESTLEFCCRLLEEEGIAFYFAPDDAGRRERLVLIDNNNDYPRVELAIGDEVTIIEHDPEEADRESIRGLLWRQRRHINKVAGRAYNFKAADAFDEHEDSIDEPYHHHPQELYLHDHRRQITDDPLGDPGATSFDGTGLPQQQRLVQQVLEEHRAQTKTGYGHGNVTGFAPGRQLQLAGHHRGDVDGASLLLVRVVHVGEFDEKAATAGATYTNELTVIPMDHEFRPQQRIRRAKVYGPQLAVVVGPEGAEEIHTDQFGRIKIQFHHDRRQPRNETASCWVRVIQPWAGPGWGSFFIPRVGMEVVVQFVDGDPDQPVVVGTVYNSVNMPPYPMPDEKTKSTIKTSSSTGGNGYNELTFEDAAGNEQIIVHAQKDFNKTVINNQSRSVGANDSTSVGGDQSLSVMGDRTHSISGNESITITGSQKITVSGASTGEGQEVKGVQLDITGKYVVDASESIDVRAPNYIELRVQDTFIRIEPEKITLQQKQGARVVLSPDSALMASKQNSQVTLTADAQMQASTGGDLTLTANAQLTGNGAQVRLDGDALVQSKGQAEVKLTADAVMTGAHAAMEGSSSATVASGTEATLTAGGSTVKTTGGAVDVSGPQANIAGQGAVNITGGIIKLN